MGWPSTKPAGLASGKPSSIERIFKYYQLKTHQVELLVKVNDQGNKLLAKPINILRDTGASHYQ